MQKTVSNEVITSYVFGQPLVFANRRKIMLPKVVPRRNTQRPPSCKRMPMVYKSPTYDHLSDDSTPTPKKDQELKWTFLPYIYAQTRSGHNTPDKIRNLPLDRKSPEIFHTGIQIKEFNDYRLRRNTFNN